MSVRRITKDFIYLNVIISLILVFIVTLYYYFTTNDVNSLYMGLTLAGMIVFIAIARYRFMVDYVWTRFKRWR